MSHVCKFRSLVTENLQCFLRRRTVSVLGRTGKSPQNSNSVGKLVEMKDSIGIQAQDLWGKKRVSFVSGNRENLMVFHRSEQLC